MDSENTSPPATNTTKTETKAVSAPQVSDNLTTAAEEEERSRAIIEEELKKMFARGKISATDFYLQLTKRGIDPMEAYSLAWELALENSEAQEILKKLRDNQRKS